MLKVDIITKRFGIFLASYILLLLLAQLKPVQQAHNVYYCAVGQFFFNIVNPNYYADFIPEAGPNDKNYNMTIKLFNRKVHGNKLKNKTYVRRTQPNRMLFKNLYDLTVIPTILIFSLYIATPGIKWKKKLLYMVGSLSILYIALAFHNSHIIENVVINQGVIADSFWNKLIYIVGFGGLTESMYMISFIAYGIFALRKSVLNYFIEAEK